MDTPSRLTLILLAAGFGCSILDPTFSEPATISDDDLGEITVPATVAPGVSFTVSIQTFGGGCTRRIARTESRTEGRVAEIRPYNETTRSNVCTSDLLLLRHSVTLMFADPGPVTVRFIGEDGSGRPVQIDRMVSVQ